MKIKGKGVSMGIVYILTNPCLDGWVKIGMSERNDVEKRLRELNTPTNLPLSYRCYATYEVENPLEVERGIHSIIDRVDESLHAREQLSNGKIRVREFFKISPETAYGIFKDVALLRGDRENLKFYTPTNKEAEEAEIAEIKSKRGNNSFELLKIEVGTKIYFLPDESVFATVIDNKNQIEYEGNIYSVSALGKKLLIEKQNWSENRGVNGWLYFTKDGITLSDLRDMIEKESIGE
ncbi:MAG: GIY-YIG nuclease family protein [Bacillota bacterium]